MGKVKRGGHGDDSEGRRVRGRSCSANRGAGSRTDGFDCASRRTWRRREQQGVDVERLLRRKAKDVAGDGEEGEEGTARRRRCLRVQVPLISAPTFLPWRKLNIDLFFSHHSVPHPRPPTPPIFCNTAPAFKWRGPLLMEFLMGLVRGKLYW